MSKYINPDQSWMQGQAYRKGGGKGGGGGGQAGVSPEAIEMAKKGTFKPFTLTTSTGGAAGGPDGEFSTYLNDQLTGLQTGSYDAAGQLIPQVAGALGRDAAQFSFDSDVNATQQELFASQSALLADPFQQQNDALKSTLLGSGRMGLSVNGRNPDVFGLAQQQQGQLAQLGVTTRQQALAEQQQQYGIESGNFQANQAMEQQRSNNLLLGAQNMTGLGQSLSGQELAYFQAALAGEQARSGSYLGAAQVMAPPQQQKQKSGGKGIMGMIGTGVGAYFGGPQGAAMGGQIGSSLDG
ncbi:MAG: hypothetical protein JKY52_20925 [Flavobacteriales bacterium]|nr:hypothetical protein [Flavobacteriales bacterium]